jgi:maleylacetoacetate isomerase
VADPVLYGYWRSSAAYRVRIALNLKRITATAAPVDLRQGEQRGGSYKALAPAGLVPMWEEDGFRLGQSLSIITYIDECFPDPPLLPQDPRLRAVCREIAYTIACDIHPLGNLRVLDKLGADFAADGTAKKAWASHWITAGFAAIEARLAETAGRHAIGDAITLADICLVPQTYNARRFEVDLSPFPRIVAADAAARAHPAFDAAAPEKQSDAG